MHIDRQPLAHSPEHEPSHAKPAFDLEQMSLEQVDLLCQAISADTGEDYLRYEPLSGLLESAFESLVSRNIEKARELIYALAVSADEESRSQAAFALPPLIYREQESEPEHLAAALSLLMRLVDDESGPGAVGEAAGIAIMHMCGERGRLAPEVKAWINDQLSERD